MLCIFFTFKATVNYLYLIYLVLPISFFIFLIIKRKFILLCVSVLLLCFLSTYTVLYIKNFNTPIYNNIPYTISGKIEKRQNETYITYLTLSNVSLIDDNGNKINIAGNLSLNISEGTEDYDVGFTIVFSGKIKSESLVNQKGEINSYNVKNNIRYSVVGKVDAYKATFIDGKKPLNETIKSYNKQLLINNLGERNGILAYSLLYGERTEVDENLIDIFKYSGVIHIFAVSGLHISIMVGIIYFVLRKLKCNSKVILAITTLLLLFYCYLCSYAHSVVRATIMTLVVLFSKIVFKRNDSLTTLSFAGLIILSLNPLTLFDAGFQLTFCCVFGIIIFNDIFNKVKIKNKLLKDIFSLVAVTLSTQIALLPLLAKYYGYYSTWSIFANLLTLPIFSLFYPILFVINLFCLVFNFLGFLYVIPNIFLSIIIYINSVIANIPFGQIQLFYCGGVITAIYYCFLFLISKFILINKKIKPVITGLSFVFVFCLFSFNTLPSVSTKNTISFETTSLSNGYSALISTENNEYYLINPHMTYSSLNEINNHLNSKRIAKLNGIIFSKNQSFEAVRVQKFFANYNTNIYLSQDNLAINNLKQIGIKVNTISYSERTKINDNMFIEYLQIEGEFSVLKLTINNYVYLEISFDMDDYYSYEILEQFILTNINFRVNCFKINDSLSNINYYKSLINANQYVFNENNNLVLTI